MHGRHNGSSLSDVTYRLLKRFYKPYDEHHLNGIADKSTFGQSQGGGVDSVKCF